MFSWKNEKRRQSRSVRLARLVTALAAAVTAWFAAPATAQDTSGKDTPVLNPQPDPNGVDLVIGTYATASPFKVEAPAARNMSVQYFFNGRRITHSLNVWLEDRAYGSAPGETGGRYVTLHLGGVEKLFFCYGTTPCSDVSKPDGGTLSRNTSDVYTYRDRSGTVYQFFAPYSTVVACYAVEDPCDTYQLDAAVSTITYADGEKLTFAPQPTLTPNGSAWTWTDTVTSNLGYTATFSSTTTNGNTGQAGTSWLSRVDNPSTATLTRGSNVVARASVQRSFSGTNNVSQTITQQDILNRNYQLFLYANATSHCWGVDVASHQPTKVISPGNVVTDIGYTQYKTGTYTSESRVTAVTRGGKAWNYSWSFGSSGVTVQATDPTFALRTVTGVETSSAMSPNSGCEGPPPSEGHITRSSDPLSRVMTFAYGNDFYMTGATLPAGNGFAYQYDARGNLTKATRCADAGCLTSQTVYQAGYDATCMNQVTCNKPNWTKDAKGNETDYTYDTVHGGVLTATLPPDANGVRPQTRYSYTPYDTGNGILYRLTQTSECTTGTACVGTAAESRTTTTYWGATFLPETVTRAAGDGSVSTTTRYTYDDAGRPVQIMDGRGNSVYRRYDAAGRLAGEIDRPSNAGIRSARRFTYNDDDQVVTQDEGSVTGPTDTEWSAFVLLDRVTTAYDNVGQKVRETRTDAAGAIQTLMQFSYDPAGRLECTVLRMNPDVFGSLPASACTPWTPGTHGPDRITRNLYDQAGQLVQVRKAVGVSGLEQAYATYGYTANGKQEYVVDANGNRAKLAYDSYDRLTDWYFPSDARPPSFDPSTPASALASAGAASAGDYESYGYDANDNRMSLKKRDGTTLTYLYDALNRMTQKSVPVSASGSAGYTVNYGYDNRGLPLSATFASTGAGVTYGYDALGRKTTETTSMDGTSRTFSMAYDANGNRIRYVPTASTWGYVLTYSYDAQDRLTDLSDVVPVAHIEYDGAGRRWSLGQGYPSFVAATSYQHDALGRLTGLTHDLAGAADQALTFVYNPASQIETRTSSSDAYASNTAYNVSRGYSVNGLNQYTASGGNPLGYDANGNLTGNGGTTYRYDAENRLVSAAATQPDLTVITTTLAYDPIGRLWQISSPAGTTRFFYEGDRLAIEADGASNVLRSYAHGAGPDEPLVKYEVVGGVLQRRFMKADHQGSIVAITDENGNAVTIQGYDAWGIPNDAGTWDQAHIVTRGRFGYTGQAWLPELGLWYYKARMYSPTLGRFFQTDPVGYKDQVNLYAYVGNDPVDRTDPLGLKSCPVADPTPSACPDITLPPQPMRKTAADVTLKYRRSGEENGTQIYDIDGKWKIRTSAAAGEVLPGESGEFQHHIPKELAKALKILSHSHLAPLPTGDPLRDASRRRAQNAPSEDDQRAMHQTNAAVQTVGPQVTSTLYRIGGVDHLRIDSGPRSAVPGDVKAQGIVVDPE